MVETYEIASLDRREVLRYLGYRRQPMTPELESRIDEGIARALEVGRPVSSWRVFPVAGRTTLADGTPVVTLAGTSLTLRGHSMERHMAGAVACAAMAVTVGMGVERELRCLALTDRVGEVVFDAAATTLVEAAADACEASVDAWAAANGLRANRRFSPGYGDMPLDTQPVLLTALDAQRRLGITLSGSLLMTPTKSVTAVLGLFAGEPAPGAPAPSCDGCLASDGCRIRASGVPCGMGPEAEGPGKASGAAEGSPGQ